MNYCSSAPSQSKGITSTQSAASTPVVPINNVMAKSADRIGIFTCFSIITYFWELSETFLDSKGPVTKGSTVQNIERLQKERDERRAQQEQVKKAKEMEKSIEPGNPNYQFLLMIREYQSNVSFIFGMCKIIVPDRLQSLENDGCCCRFTHFSLCQETATK